MEKNEFLVEKNKKFALLALSESWIDRKLPEAINLQSDFWISRKFPFQFDKDWKEWLGTFQIEEIEDASLFVAIKKHSDSAESQNNENEELKENLRFFLSGIYLTGFCHFTKRNFILTGSNYQGKPDIQSISPEDPIIRTNGAPIDAISFERLEKALKIAKALKQVEVSRKNGDFKRIVRALHAYYSGLHANDLGEKVHQFVRSIEGFILPESGNTRKQFSSRTELFLGNKSVNYSQIIYDYRCDVEHLHGPFYSETGGPNKENRLQRHKQILETEAIARYCLSNLLLNKNIWPCFIDDIQIKIFWKPENNIKRRDIWGPPMDLRHVSSKIRMNEIRESDLML